MVLELAPALNSQADVGVAWVEGSSALTQGREGTSCPYSLISKGGCP